jgi:hypothetical protein
VASVWSSLATPPDPRIGNAQRHKLLDIPTIPLVASICGAECCVDVARDREQLFREFLELPGGSPSPMTPSRGCFGRSIPPPSRPASPAFWKTWARTVRAWSPSTARRCAARSIARRADRPCMWSRPSPPARVVRRGNGLMGGVTTLAGAFAAYSPSRSAHFRGRLVRGALRLEVGRGGSLAGTYSEVLVGREVRLTAGVQITGRPMHMPLREADSELPLYVSLHLPEPPASVFCRVMSGIAFCARGTALHLSRRLHPRPRGGETRRHEPLYPSEPGVIAGALAALGLRLAALTAWMRWCANSLRCMGIRSRHRTRRRSRHCWIARTCIGRLPEGAGRRLHSGTNPLRTRDLIGARA